MSEVTREQFENLVRTTIPMSELFDFKVEELDRGRIRARIFYNDKLLRAGGTLNGAIVFTLADMALYGICLSLIGLEPLAVTANLNINFLRKPGPADLIAEGTVLKTGRSLVFGEVKIYSDGASEVVAHAAGSYARPPAATATAKRR